MDNQADIYNKITASIIEAIEKGCGAFKMPWNTFGLLPSNASNNRQYRGINILVLWAAGAKSGYATQLWATYQQWRELGAQVRRNEKSTAIVFWKFFGEDSERHNENGKIGEIEFPHKHCLARAYQVFNAAQVDGFTIVDSPVLPELKRISAVEQFFSNTGATIIENGCRASYDSKADEIHMPPFSIFKTADHFYSVLAHESIHFTGHESRCNRQLANRFGSECYAAEELIAELGSAFLSAELQLKTKPRADNAPYIQNWLRVLRNDRRAIFTAAAKAQHAVDWLFAQQSCGQAT